ncbi:hypothetical protein GOL25_30895, partial [Sinorhizobium medicae]|nr:hypothetical protein [Sinorhizobium medicae]
SIFDLFAEHEIGRELEAMSQWLDAHRERWGGRSHSTASSCQNGCVGTITRESVHGKG